MLGFFGECASYKMMVLWVLVATEDCGKRETLVRCNVFGVESSSLGFCLRVWKLSIVCFVFFFILHISEVIDLLRPWM